MPNAHSRFSASNFSADAACPGRQVVTGRGRLQGPDLEGFIGVLPPPDSAGYDAARGTAAHTLLLDRCMPMGVDPEMFLKEVLPVDGYQIIVDEAMVEMVRTAQANLSSLIEGADLVEFEVKLDYHRVLQVDETHAWGTADAVAVWNDPFPRILVYDFKSGAGVTVDVAGSDQLRLYAAGAHLQYLPLVDPDFVLVIDQPRVFDEPQVLPVTSGELLDWAQTHAQPAASDIYEADALACSGMDFRKWAEEFLTPNETSCRWCSFKTNCPSHVVQLRFVVQSGRPALPEEFDDLIDSVDSGLAAVIDPDSPEGPSLAQAVANGLNVADQLEQLAKAYRALGEKLIVEGTQVPGWKLVEGKRGARAWVDEDAAEEILTQTFRLKADEAYNRKLISPTQAEKILTPRRWRKLQSASLITQAPGKAHLAPESDKRPALNFNVADAFEEVTEEELA
jgi:hypothetical protein